MTGVAADSTVIHFEQDGTLDRASCAHFRVSRSHHTDMADTGILTFETANLGDDMQSLAVLSHLDRVHAWLDRDRLPEAHLEADTACVFNCWFLNRRDHRRPPSRLDPIWHGFAGWKESLLGEWMDYLKDQARLKGPIGCRDLHTAGFLSESGVQADWTGCLTLFLGRLLPIPADGREGVLFVDVPVEAERHIPKEVIGKAVRLSTFPPESIVHSPLRRWAMVSRLAQALACAELVVTRRLHVALPAAGYRTPVVAIPDVAISDPRRRFAGFESIFPTVFLDDAAAGLRKLDWVSIAPPEIPQHLVERWARFRQGLQARGLACRPIGERTLLDDASRQTQCISNVGQLARPGSVRLRLGERWFELAVRLWTDGFIEVGLEGFPGLSKLELVVEVRPYGSKQWDSWGRLRELAVATDGAGPVFGVSRRPIGQRHHAHVR